MKGIFGADIFINLLLVFIITTGLLLMNTNNPKNMDGRSEMEMPRINLPTGDSGEWMRGKQKQEVTISAKKVSGRVHYFIDNETVNLSRIGTVLKGKVISAARIRVDKDIAYGRYMEILGICKDSGIKEIYNVYVAENEEDLAEYIIRIAGREICRYDLMQEKTKIFKDVQKNDPQEILKQERNVVGELVYKYRKGEI